MGPAFETFLTALGILLLILVALGFLLRPLWPRVARFFRRWYARDLLREEARKAELAGRQKAEKEVQTWVNSEVDPPVEQVNTLGKDNDNVP